MKRRDLLRHVKRHGCVLLREEANHSLYANPARGKLLQSQVHDFVTCKNRQDLEIAEMKLDVFKLMLNI